MQSCFPLVRIATLAVVAAVIAGPLLAEGPEFRPESVIVQTLTFDDITKRSGTFEFPAADQTWERILMHYTLKCDQATTADDFPCGEWDYITNTEIVDSSGVLDSTRFSQPNFTVDGAARDEFAFTRTPSVSMRQTPYTMVSGAFGGSYHSIGEGSTEDILTLPGNGLTARSIYLWTAAELSAAGLQAGNIGAIKLPAGTADREIHVKVRLRAATGEPQTDGIDAGWQEVYDSPVTLGNTAANELLFHTAFNWDGTSDLHVEISSEDFENTIRVILDGERLDSPTGLQAVASRHAWFHGDDWLEVPAAAFESLNEAVTVMFWQYGDPAIQPQNNYTFEGRDAAGNRVLNVHLPWDNGQVYWDAGNAGTGAYDRIQKQAGEADYEGRWNYWAFTKDIASGEMKIYLNGELWHSGTGMTRGFAPITEFRLGGAVNGGGNYDGGIDEFMVFDVALTQAEVRTLMHHHLNGAAAPASALRVYYPFNDKDGSIRDESNNNFHAIVHGSPQMKAPRARDLTWGFRSTNVRPIIAFGAGDAASTSGPGIRTWAETNDRVALRRFANNYENRQVPLDAEDHPGTPVNLELVFPAGVYTYSYDAAGNKIDSTIVPAEGELTRSELIYFSPIVRYEIGRYITPYGIGLDLGPEGVTWVYDVTDFAPLLHDYVWLRAHNNQELIDLKFEFIPGTPARDVVSVNNLYDGRPSYKALADDEVAQAQTITPRSDADMWKLRTIISGHGFGGPTQCGEFCQRDFNYMVNGEKAFEWLVWKECGSAPIHPQGGTWLFDRAGWCPGEIVDMAEHDLTPYLSGGNPIELDFGIEHYSPNAAEGNWDVSSQLISYGAPNHQVDAALEQIIAPSDWELNSRFNPICGAPIIRIKNGGAQKLTAVDIEYGLRGGNKATYTWTGELEFLESADVILPLFDWSTSDGENIFEVKLSNPNGTVDEYKNNDAHFSRFETVPVFPPEFEVNLRTNNNAAQQYSWTLRKADGTLIGEASNLQDNRLYTTEFVLEEGCYEFELINREGYGLDFWFLRDQLGTGGLQFTSLGQVIQSFDPDFGNFTRMQFRVGNQPAIKVDKDTLDFGMVPVGETRELTVEITPANELGLIVSDISIPSISRRFEIVSISPSLDGGDVELAFGESMSVTVKFEPTTDAPVAADLRIRSNDSRFATKRVVLSGNQVISSVGNPAYDTPVNAFISVEPNPVEDAAALVYTLESPIEVATRISIVNALGVEVMHLDEGLRGFGEYTLPLNTAGLANGAYFVVLRAGATTLTHSMVVRR